MFKRALPFICLAFLLFSGCKFRPTPATEIPVESTQPITTSSAPTIGPIVPSGNPEIHELEQTTETVWNCGPGGSTITKHPSKSILTNYAVEWEIGGSIGTGVRIPKGKLPFDVDLSTALEGHYVTGLEQAYVQGVGWDLSAEPDSTVSYTLSWQEEWQPGYVEIHIGNQSLGKVNLRYRTGIRSDVVGKIVQSPCQEQGQKPTETEIIVAPTITPTVIPTETPNSFNTDTPSDSILQVGQIWTQNGVGVILQSVRFMSPPSTNSNYRFILTNNSGKIIFFDYNHLINVIVESESGKVFTWTQSSPTTDHVALEDSRTHSLDAWREGSFTGVGVILVTLDIPEIIHARWRIN